MPGWAVWLQRPRLARVWGCMANKPLLSVMMPAYNEDRTIEMILNHVLDRPEVGEVIAVDDGSTDQTWKILSRLAREDSRVRAFRHETNLGKAPRCGERSESCTCRSRSFRTPTSST